MPKIMPNIVTEKQVKIAGENARAVETSQIVKKPWGREEIEYAAGDLMVKRLTMEKGRQCSVQLHKIKKEVATVLSGKLDYITVKQDILNVPEQERTMDQIEKFINQHLTLKPGDMVVVEPGTIHYMRAADEAAVYREVSFGPNQTTRIFDPNASLRQGEDITR